MLTRYSLSQALVTAVLRKLCSQLSAESAVRVENIMTMVFGNSNEGASQAAASSSAPYRHCRDWEVLATTITGKKLIPTPTFFRKCIDIDEALCFRSGVVVVGEPGSYKSTIIDVVVSAFNRGLGGEQFTLDNARVQRLYPSVHSFDTLFGSHDSETGGWHDGIFSRTIRVLSDTEVRESGQDQESSKHTWTVFDGAVTSRWSDALISCLKSERRLCLPSGEVLAFPRTSRLIFEAPSLENASPHIVGACYIVCMTSSIFPASVTLKNWCHRLPELLSPLRGVLQGLYRELFVPCAQYVSTSCPHTKGRTLSSFLHTFLRYFDCMIDDFRTATPEELKRRLEAGVMLRTATFVGKMKKRSLGKGKRKASGEGGKWSSGMKRRISKMRIDKLSKPKAHTFSEVRTEQQVHYTFLFSLLWALGGALSDQEREGLEEKFRTLCETLAQEGKLKIMFPSGRLVPPPPPPPPAPSQDSLHTLLTRN